MALTATTLSAAVYVDDTTISLTSATGVAAGSLIQIDREFMQVTGRYTSSNTSVKVIRGIDGTANRPINADRISHPSGANVLIGTTADFANPSPSEGVADAISNPAQPAFPVQSYSAAGAIQARQGIHILNGTVALAMTLAVPT